MVDSDLRLRDLDLSDKRNVEDLDPVAAVRVNGQKSSVGRDAGVIGSGNRVAAAVSEAHGKWPEWRGSHSFFDRFFCHIRISRIRASFVIWHASFGFQSVSLPKPSSNNRPSTR